MKKKVFVDFSREKSFVRCQERLHNLWGFSNTSIAQVLEKHRDDGLIVKYSPEHYTVLRELFDQHLLRLESSISKEAYLVSAKSKVTSFYNPASVGCVITVFSSVMSLVCKVNEWDIYSFMAAVVAFVTMALFIYARSAIESSPINQFYKGLFGNLEKPKD